MDALLAGPRGRRMLLEIALESEGPNDVGRMLLAGAVSSAVRTFEPPGTTIWIGVGPRPKERAPATPDEVARLLSETSLAEASPTRLRAAMARSVDMARYWQEPDGTDQVAATAEVRAALERVAEHVAPTVSSWWRPIDVRHQWSVRWDEPRIGPPTALSMAELRRIQAEQIEQERRAQRDRPADPTANMSGEWWSTPGWPTPSTNGATFDGSPAALWFVEDSLGWERGLAYSASVSSRARVFEIDCAEAWGELCARFPSAVTALRRHDWYRTTGRIGQWVLPDWAAVAEHYDAVHLQIGAYLAAAGTAIPAGGAAASVIAGWSPGETYWVTEAISFADEPATWLSGDGGTGEWTRE
ncbi:hypothetical protein ACU045_12705 [Microbacterium sp. MAHUQ-60]|uniref:hypothetical protein n=1 Tax=unclassified Microbacterium TaxID=2609290 RepID=UPI00360D4F65